MDNKWVFIANPYAGNRYSFRNLDHIKEMINKYKPGSKLVLTNGPGHATKLATEHLASGYSHIIAIGGDGTVNETARALVGNTEAVFGVVPGGTGNDFNHITGFPDRFHEKEWEILCAGNSAVIDAGLCNGRHFFNGMGLGFDAEVTAALTKDREKSGRSSKLRYTWFILKTLLSFREKPIVVNIDGTKGIDKCFISTISIGRRYAGTYMLTPEAIADDKLFDLCWIREISFLKRLIILLKVPTGTHLAEREVSYSKISKIFMEFKQAVPAHLDGELFFADAFDVTIIPAALNILYNPQGNHFISEKMNNNWN